MRPGGTTVFISHNRKEKPWVRRLVAQWRQLGFRVFFDEDTILPGEDVIHALERGVSDADHIILVLSNASIASRWVSMETAMAMYGDPDGRERRVIPVLIEPVDPQRLPLAIRRLNIVDLTNESTKDERYKHLLRSLGIPESELPELPNPDDSITNGQQQVASALPAVPKARRTSDSSAFDPVLRRILFFVLAAVVVVLLIAYWWGRTHYDTNTVYIFDLSATNGSTQGGSNVFEESIEDLVQVIETNSTRPPYPEKSQVVMPTADRNSQPALCRMQSPSRMRDLERQTRLTHFINSCRRAIRAAPQQRTTGIGAAWRQTALTFDPDADRGKTIIMFSDLAEDPATVIAASADLYDTCVAVIYVAPPLDPLESGSVTGLRPNWNERLIHRRVRRIRLWHLNAFDPDMVTDFVRGCISATR